MKVKNKKEKMKFYDKSIIKTEENLEMIFILLFVLFLGVFLGYYSSKCEKNDNIQNQNLSFDERSSYGYSIS